MAAECPRCFAAAQGDYCPLCGLTFGAVPDSPQWRQHDKLQASWLFDPSNQAYAENYERVARRLASQGLPQPQPLGSEQSKRRLGEAAQRIPPAAREQTAVASEVHPRLPRDDSDGFRPTPGYLLGAGYWTTVLELLMPALVLVAWIMGVLVILRGWLGAGLLLLLVSSLVAGVSAAVWASMIL